MKLSVDSCSALNIPVVWQWRRWQFQRRAKWLFSPQCAGFDPRSRTLKDPDSLRTLLATSPLLVWMYSKGTSRPADLQDKSVKSQPYVRETFGLTVSLSICLSDWSTTITTIALPEIAVRDYLFGEPHLFFKWPYLSLKKMRHLGTMGAGNVSLVFKLFCVSLSDVVVIKAPCCHWGHWASVV